MKVSKNPLVRKKKSETTFKNLAMEEYYNHNDGDFRMANIEMTEAFSNDPLFKCVQEKFSPYLNARPITALPEKIQGCDPFQQGETAELIPPEQFTKDAKEALFNECEERLRNNHQEQ